MFESHLMPLPTPDKADSVDANITMTNAISIATFVGAPSAFMIPSKPVILWTPAAN
jgi:hypothetical protein|tara:strand:- start:92 stop:259 length:168 start_codon:yes stop_codon:yes gene_type:complete